MAGVKVCEHNHLFGEVFLTGCTPWTLYQYDWYLGDSLCLPAGQRATDTGSDFEQTLNQLHPLLEQKCKRVFYVGYVNLPSTDFEQTLNQLHPLLEQKCKRVF